MHERPTLKATEKNRFDAINRVIFLNLHAILEVTLICKPNKVLAQSASETHATNYIIDSFVGFSRFH